MKNKPMYALGRLKSGQMNKTEAAYADYLEGLKANGAVLWYRFEGVKLRLADSTFYTPDFAVMSAAGTLEMHEVKGCKAIFADDAKVKVKVADEMYPFMFYVCYPIPKNKGGGWNIERVGNGN